MHKAGLLAVLLVATLSGCGGSDNDAFQPGTGGTSAPVATTLTLVTSSPTLASDGSTPAEITAYVRDANNQLVESVSVVFSASSGALAVTQATSGTDGTATASLTPLTPERRTITVTATAGTVTSSVNVDVVGSTITIQGPATLTLQQQGTYTVTLKNAANVAIANQTVTVASARSNTLSAASVTTDSTGTATFNMTAANSGDDTITVNGAGLTASQTVAVNSDSFTFTAPASGTEVALGATQTVTVRWLVANVAQVGQSITFSTTRGTVSPQTVVTDSTGSATATVSSVNAGGAIITAGGGASSAELSIEFVAQTAATIDVQPSAFTIGTEQTSTIIAVVRDPTGNLVKNKTVDFTLTDITGGWLSLGSVLTDSQGRAQTVYTASTTTSANEGVKIDATVRGSSPVVTKQVALTVAKREVFLSLGTGNEIDEPNVAQYKIDYIVQVTDSNGNGVANVALSLRMLSQRYYKGYRSAAVSPATGWTTTYTVAGGCADEDVNRNGILDSGEDFNTSTRIEAGNIAAVTPSNATTDADGFALVSVYYPQEYAYYLDVTLSASATVQGTEYVRTSSFMLPGSSTDFNSTTNAAPGPVSPFGSATVCTNPL